MCHLFAVSSNAPRTLAPFLDAFAPFAETESPDGWGLAATSAAGTTLVKEPQSFAVAYREGGFSVLRAAKTSATTLLFHIRESSVGKHTMENTHPFRRRAFGKTFLFAHNGTVPDVKKRPLLRFEPGGETDSEYAFLWLLEAMPPYALPRLSRWLRDAGNDIRALGKFNFILIESDTIWAFADTALTWCTRVEAPEQSPSAFEAALAERGRSGSARGVRGGRSAATGVRAQPAPTTRTLRSILIATCPFTSDRGDTWHPLAPGSLIVARRGRVLEVLE